MDTPFDITQKPLSLAEVEQERETLKDRKAAGERRLRHDMVMIVLLSGLILSATIGGNAYWDLLPWLAIVLCIMGIVAITAVGFILSAVNGAGSSGDAAFGCVVGGLVGGLTGVLVGGTIGDPICGVVGSFVGVGVSALGFTAGTRIECLCGRIDSARLILADFDDASRETCLDIKDWLEDDTIRQYRDWVQAEGRLFMAGEVKAMREHWESCSQHQADAERAAAIDAACREVYVENLVKS